MNTADTHRSAFFIESGDADIFAWLHVANEAPTRDVAVLICPPLNHEYLQCHRTIRHLADQLSMRGLPCMRFDYRGTGDSSGTELDEGLFDHWVNDIQTLIATLRSTTGCSQVCVVGLRMGASLAALAATQTSIDSLILWNPCVKGSQFLRELRAIAMSKGYSGKTDEGLFESSGFFFSKDTEARISQLDLLQIASPNARHILLIDRDDLPSKPDYALKLAQHCEQFQRLSAPGYAAMMVSANETIVPFQAITQICAEIDRLPCAQGSASNPKDIIERLARQRLSKITKHLESPESIEVIPHAEGIFGILSKPDRDFENNKPVLVLFNAGAVHHVGPGRLYTTLSRTLTTKGITVFRCDLSGIGDSVTSNLNEEGKPYPKTALPDSIAIMTWLKHCYPGRQIIPAGLCAGAHTAFRLAVDGGMPLTQILLINPLVFQWKDGMSLDIGEYETAARHTAKSSTPSAGLVQKLIKKIKTGDIPIQRIIKFVTWKITNKLSSTASYLTELLLPQLASPLSKDLTHLSKSGCQVALVLSSRDPGLVMMQDQAGFQTKKAIKSGRLAVTAIDDSDHTFTQLAARQRLITHLTDWIDKFNPKHN